MEDIEHHVKEEENDMFPMVEDQFSSEVVDQLGARMEAEKAKFKQFNSKTASSKQKAGASGR